MASYHLSGALGADTVVSASVSSYGATAADYGALFYRTGNTAYSDSGWIAVTGNQVTLARDITDFQMKVDVRADTIIEYGEAFAFVVNQTATSTALIDSWYVAATVAIIEFVLVVGVPYIS